MTIARSFRDLNVYRKARETAQKIFELTRQFPSEERYSLTDQIRRSSRAVKAMIAEAWGRRRYKAVFVNELDEALGEATKTQSWLDDARASNYLSADEFNEVDSNCIAICRMLSRMIDRAEDFCKHSPATDYREIPRIEEKESISDQSSKLAEFFVGALLTSHQ
jgi:four helix bundle protein